MRPKTAATPAKLSTADRITLQEIAALADVSSSTVSKVLNGRHGVSAQTRERVNGLLEVHGYRRRGVLNRSQVGLIDLVFSGLETLWAFELLVGAEQEAARAGVGLVLTDAHGRRVGNRHWLGQIASRRTDGIVLIGSHLMPGAGAELAKLNTPLVQVDPVGDAPAHVPSVAATNWAGGLAATEHLLSLGHRRIGIINGPSDLACSQDRLAGYHAALLRAGVPSDPALVTSGDFLVPSGRSGGAALLDLDEPPTAIFAASDTMAHGVYLEATSRGLSIPRDLSVVGFDDIALCEWLTPTLTTVRQPLAEMAAEATRMLLLLARQQEQPVSMRRELATTLVVRESTAGPRSAPAHT
jgi:LacI family transcriptional regulator